MRRVFLIVLDSFGIGELPDSDKYGDKGTNTLKSCFETGLLHVPVMESMGLYNIDGVDFAGNVPTPTACFGKAAEKSKGKDTTTGHWELAGLITSTPFKTYPDGFEKDVIEQFSKATGREVLCNKPYSGTQVLADYGNEHMKTGALIVYTSADSVFQIAAHEDIVPVETLYQYCHQARKILPDIGRIIARPFVGKDGNFTRTLNRRDFALSPPCDTILDDIKNDGLRVISIGKINDIFSARGITEHLESHGNKECIEKLFLSLDMDFEGLCFTNLVDFDSIYGHRNDAAGYANALNEFDAHLSGIVEKLREDDLLIITADHGCDPGFIQSTDHTREYVPVLCYGQKIRRGVNLGTLDSFSDIGKTVCSYLGVTTVTSGKSFIDEILR